MKRKERLEKIVSEVNKHGEIKIADLSKTLGYSEVTIRSDVSYLDQRGALERIHGGAIKKEYGVAIELLEGEFYQNSERKARIAKRAFEYIEVGDSIIIDDSTTGSYLAKYIKANGKKEIAVVTNSIMVAAELSSASHIQLFILGGQVIGSPPSSLDNITVNNIKQFHADKAFVGVHGISLTKGLTSMGTPQMEVKREIIKASNATYVIADSSKFGNTNLFTVCPIDQIKKIITDRDLPKATIQEAKDKKIELDLV